ncbi:TPA: hypothetical protein ACH0TE_003616 [Citrobacter farmeri]|nr:hypothetical protein [Citrobacter farmeri]HCD7631499.1 hypothetical protein [Citrobacter farmeri]
MKVKKITYIQNDDRIDVFIEFNPLKLSRRAVLVVNGNVIATTAYSRHSRPNVLSIDYRFAGGVRTITAISASSPGNLKQGLQLRIDNEFVAGERELDLEQNDVTNMSYTVQQDITERSVDVPFGFFNGRFAFLRLYALILLIFLLFNTKRRGPEFLTTMSPEGLAFTLAFSFFLTGVYLIVMKLLNQWIKKRRLFS